MSTKWPILLSTPNVYKNLQGLTSELNVDNWNDNCEAKSEAKVTGLYAVCRWIPVSHVMFLTILLLRSFLFLFILILTLKIDWQCARASHVTPSFLTDDKLEL